MISARDALKLPSAQLRPSDAEAAASLLAEIDTYVREHMGPGGCVVPVDPARVNQAIVIEVERVCRSLGWEAEFQRKMVPSAFDPRQVTNSFQLSLRPSVSAYEEP